MGRNQITGSLLRSFFKAMAEMPPRQPNPCPRCQLEGVHSQAVCDTISNYLKGTHANNQT
jgi:hypothetical protein